MGQRTRLEDVTEQQQHKSKSVSRNGVFGGMLPEVLREASRITAFTAASAFESSQDVFVTRPLCSKARLYSYKTYPVIRGL